MVEEDFENWKVLGLNEVTHKSFCYLISDLVLFFGNRRVNQLGEQIESSYPSKNALIFRYSRLIKFIKLIFLFFIRVASTLSCCLLYGFISLFKKGVDKELLNIVVNYDFDSFIKINAILYFKQELLDVFTQQFLLLFKRQTIV